MPRYSLLLFVLVSALRLSAQERQYTIGTGISLAGGGTNRLSRTNFGPALQDQPFFFFYGAYPSVTMVSTGAKSVFDASYSFGLSRGEGNTQVHSDSHSASIGFSTPTSQNWKFNLSESFSSSDNRASFDAFRGAAEPAEMTDFIFDPVAFRRLGRTNSASANVDYSFNERSTLSFGGGHRLRNYGRGGTLDGALLNQQRWDGDIAYRQRTNERETWTAGYSASYSDFREASNAYSQGPQVGYSIETMPGLTFRVTLGLNRVQSPRLREGYTGFNTSVNLQKTTQTNSYSLYYRQGSGRSSGLGSLSNIRRAGFSFQRNGRNLNVSLSVSASEATGALDNVFKARGVQGVATIGAPLTRKLSISGSAQYQKYSRAAQFSMDRRQVYISLRYNEPELLSFSR
jgi:hypothetical protein